MKYYGEKKLLVGRIRFSNTKTNNQEKKLHDLHDNEPSINERKNGNTKIIPIYMSEKNLKIINKTFMH